SCTFSRAARLKGAPVMGARRIRREQRQFDMALSRRTNSPRKVAERVRKDARMMDVVKNGKLPFIPPVMSWLSVKLDKPARQITQQDGEKLRRPKVPAAPARAGCPPQYQNGRGNAGGRSRSRAGSQRPG